MTFFFDTNVCIGFIFKWNPWHDQAIILFNKECDSYWSETVKEECIIVFQKLVREYIVFLNNIKNKILTAQKDFFLVTDLFNIVKQINVTLNHEGKEIIDKIKVISTIFEDEGWYDISKEDILDYLNELSLNFSIYSFERFKKCDEKLKLHPKTSNHHEIKKILKSNNIHKPDWQICLDAHDLASNVSDLKFVTSDFKLINHLIPIIDLTNINGIHKMDKLKIFL